MVSVSFRANVDVFRSPLQWVPLHPTAEAYAQIFSDPQLLRALANSYVVASAVTLFSLALAVLASYSFSRFDFRGSRILQMFIIGTQMIPPIALVIPYFIMIVALKLYDTFQGLVITYTSFVLPFATLMLTSYFNTIPRDLEEAAMVDGCSRLGSMVRILLPNMLPGLVATGIYAFLLAWNEFLFAVVLTRSPGVRLITVAIAALMGEHAYEWNEMMGLSMLASAPLMVAFLFLQRYLVSGLTVGAVKG
jgi:multiple sugar transport system permease protein